MEIVPALTRLKGVLARVWPWLVALAILAFLLAKVPMRALLEALKSGPWFRLAGYTFSRHSWSCCWMPMPPPYL